MCLCPCLMYCFCILQCFFINRGKTILLFTIYLSTSLLTKILMKVRKINKEMMPFEKM